MSYCAASRAVEIQVLIGYLDRQRSELKRNGVALKTLVSCLVRPLVPQEIPLLFIDHKGTGPAILFARETFGAKCGTDSNMAGDRRR